MIAVTGTPRSGTSLIMQIIKALGGEITGQKHTSVNIEKYNPGGYWELPFLETIQGVNTTKYKGKAVKLFGSNLYATKPKYVSKVIFITREPVAAINSLLRLMAATPDYPMAPTWENAELCYDNSLAFAELFIGQNDDKPCLELTHKDLLSDPELWVSYIHDFLDMEKSDKLQKAINIIKRT